MAQEEVLKRKAAALKELDLTQADLDNNPELGRLAEELGQPDELPSGWSSHVDEGRGRLYYFQEATGTTQWEHPRIDYYRGAIYMELGGYAELLESAAENPPTKNEIGNMAKYFGIGQDEDKYVHEVAVLAVSACLPDNWVEDEDSTGRLVFRNTATGALSLEHPLDGYFRELVAIRREELKQWEQEDSKAPTFPQARGVSSENIKVAIRARPIPERARHAWDVDAEGAQLVLKKDAHLKWDPRFYGDVGMVDAAGTPKQPTYSFDSVFGFDSTTRQLFDSVVLPVVHDALMGINGTVFAYGQTGSGKTYTILGDQSNPRGAIALAVDTLFRAPEAKKTKLTVAVMELYNEVLWDLLNPPARNKKMALKADEDKGMGGLNIVEDSIWGTHVQGVTETVIESADQMMKLLMYGLQNRQVAATAMNQQSSRSHTIIRFRLDVDVGGGKRRTSTLNFVDLAGSERLKKTGTDGINAKESRKINLSLLMLGQVIAKLAQGEKKAFIPFRNSKLTRLLKPCLGGNSKTCIITTVNTDATHAEETANTLRFATRAMKVVNRIEVNERDANGAIGQGLTVQQAENLAKYDKMCAQQLATESKLKNMHTTLERLHNEKALLMEYVEELSGQPLGSVEDALPPMPIMDLDLPAQGPRAADKNTNYERAVASIARIANLGNPSYGGSKPPKPPASKKSDLLGGKHGSRESELCAEALQSVRMLRAERDELRRTYAKMQASADKTEDKVAKSAAAMQEVKQVSEDIRTLESLIGGRLDEAGRDTLTQRFTDIIEAVAIMQAEMSSMERQLSSTLAQLRAEQSRSGMMQQELERYKTSDIGELREQLDTALRATAEGAVEKDVAISLSLISKRAEELQTMLDSAKLESSELQKELDKWTQTSDGDDGTPLPGSAAMRIAREARAKLLAFEDVLQERDKVIEKLQEKLAGAQDELSNAVGVGGAADGDGHAPTDEASVLRKKVGILSREMAALKQEKDALLANMAEKVGGPALPQEVIDQVFAVKYLSQGHNMWRDAARQIRAGENAADVLVNSPELNNQPRPDLPPLSSSSSGEGRSSRMGPNKGRAHGSASRSQATPDRPAFDSRPIPVSVKNRNARAQDRSLTGAKANSAAMAKLATAAATDPQQMEILDLKKKLVVAERSRQDLAAQVQTERRAAHLQAGTAKKAQTQISELARQLHMAQTQLAEADRERAMLQCERDDALRQLKAIRG